MSSTTTAREELVNLRSGPGLFEQPPEELVQLQLVAAQEAFERHREQVPLLDFRAREAGIDRIESLGDLVPLLFSHGTYKSYPVSFVTEGRWDRLLKWYDTLAGVSVADLELDGVQSIDDFVDRLWEAGYYAYLTSGTSGKCSLLNHTQADRDLSAEMRRTYMGWPDVIESGRRRRAYRFAAPSGPNRGLDTWSNTIAAFADPASVTYLIEEPMRVSHHMRAGAIRKAMVDGTATPAEIANYQAAIARRQAAIAARFQAMVDGIAEHRDEPLFVSGGWAMQYRLIEGLQDRGVPAGSFHADTLLSAGGGRKDPSIPATVVEQVLGYFGDVRYANHGYAMSEMSDAHRACEHGRYHLLPWIIVLPLDAPATRLLRAESGVVEARYAFLDLSLEGRWGGVITGDRVHVDHDACECGRPGATILPDIARYGELGEEDKIDCAGNIDNYVKGLVGA